MALVALAVLNALLLGRFARDDLERIGAEVALPARMRAAAAVSLGLWLAVAACGRLIAYF
jgi:hypothetical protein